MEEQVLDIKNVKIKGGEFLIKDQKAEDIFTPEEFGEEELMIADMVTEFVRTRIVPNYPKLEKLDLELSKQLLEEAGELGILGLSIPEKYEGTEQSFLTNMLVQDRLSEASSFSLTIGAHTGIGTLPILYFGDEAQKTKYLPKLASGELKAAYCLTEPGSGSDALAAKSRAELSEDGTHYLLNGQKMWITNGGLADVFVVFAKIDGEKFTGFIVERQWEGVSTGAEEEKLGIKASSTRQVFFENVKVPVENVLGDIGKGHRIAFNILNIGRIKLAVGVVAASKLVIDHAVQYANERQQFKQSISNFGAIQHKLAEQAIRTWVNESANFRASADIQIKEEELLESGKGMNEALLGAAEEYALECALLKVTGSECLDYVVDEGLQIYGGMGYSEEAPMARAYRDARINRIFEGTNEINRMLSVGRLLKSALKGDLDLFKHAMSVQQELMTSKVPTYEGDKLLGREHHMVKSMKKAVLMTLGATVQALQKKIQDEQEVMMNIADMIADVYLLESALLRTEKLIASKGEAACQNYIDMVQVFADDAMERLVFNGKRAITAWAEGDMKKMLLKGLRIYTRYEGINTKAARRRIAKTMIEANKYCF